MFSEKDITKALEKVDTELQELQESRYLIEHADELDLTEEMYHRLCHTPLWASESLGRALGVKLEFPFRERKANHFIFTLPNGWRLLVPTYDTSLVEIEVDRYYSEKNHEAHYLEHSLQNTRRKISDIEMKFFGGNFSEKAKFVYGKRFRVPVIQKAMYLGNNLHKHYVQRYTEILQELRKEEAGDLARLKASNEAHEAGRASQRKYLDEYGKMLLQWTKTIFVRQVGDTDIKETIEVK